MNKFRKARKLLLKPDINSINSSNNNKVLHLDNDDKEQDDLDNDDSTINSDTSIPIDDNDDDDNYEDDENYYDFYVQGDTFYGEGTRGSIIDMRRSSAIFSNNTNNDVKTNIKIRFADEKTSIYRNYSLFVRKIMRIRSKLIGKNLNL